MRNTRIEVEFGESTFSLRSSRALEFGGRLARIAQFEREARIGGHLDAQRRDLAVVEFEREGRRVLGAKRRRGESREEQDRRGGKRGEFVSRHPLQ